MPGIWPDREEGIEGLADLYHLVAVLSWPSMARCSQNQVIHPQSTPRRRGSLCLSSQAAPDAEVIEQTKRFLSLKRPAGELFVRKWPTSDMFVHSNRITSRIGRLGRAHTTWLIAEASTEHSIGVRAIGKAGPPSDIWQFGYDLRAHRSEA
jgi:hypothetical protein